MHFWQFSSGETVARQVQHRLFISSRVLKYKTMCNKIIKYKGKIKAEKRYFKIFKYKTKENYYN